jgi:hypothetical protein
MLKEIVMNNVGRSAAQTGRNMNISESDFLHLDAALDEALKQSFPASDPIAVNSTAAAFYKSEAAVTAVKPSAVRADHE